MAYGSRSGGFGRRQRVACGGSAGSDPELLGEGVADMLLSQGAEELIRSARG